MKIANKRVMLIASHQLNLFHKPLGFFKSNIHCEINDKINNKLKID